MQNFTEILASNWTDHFQCPVSTIERNGTTLLPNEQYAKQNLVVLWHIGQHSFAVCDPFCLARLNAIAATLPANTSLSGEHLRQILGANEIVSHDVGALHYLHPADLPALASLPPFSLRQLTLPDQAHMRALADNCTAEEVDEGYVEVDHEIAFGCFFDDQLVAAASGYRRTGFMDIGVLTHSGFRRLGLGKAVVHAICEWTIAKDIIAQYRCNIHNAGSLGVARALGFKYYYSSESITLAP
ncbi:MAG: GNAT family N-acetyltransferase [Anaerolineales bacterium]|nr:GNAT family N-acetyltransferase [Anaerolineales bacterium]